MRKGGTVGGREELPSHLALVTVKAGTLPGSPSLLLSLLSTGTLLSFDCGKRKDNSALPRG